MDKYYASWKIERERVNAVLWLVLRICVLFTLRQALRKASQMNSSKSD